MSKRAVGSLDCILRQGPERQGDRFSLTLFCVLSIIVVANRNRNLGILGDRLFRDRCHPKSESQFFVVCQKVFPCGTADRRVSSHGSYPKVDRTPGLASIFCPQKKREERQEKKEGEEESRDVGRLLQGMSF